MLCRDQYVETVEQGYLFPFGHRASLATISQREVTGQIGGLIQDLVLTVQEAEKRYDGLAEGGYPHQGREMPLKSVRIAREHSRPAGASNAFPLDVTATDGNGNQINFNVTMLFVRDNEVRTGQRLEEVTEQFQREATVEINGQRVALADSRLSGSDTEAAVAMMDFGVQRTDISGPVQPPFLPLIRGADVSVPAIEQLLGSAAGSVSSSTPNRVKMAFHPRYLAKGFLPSDNPKQVFAKFFGSIPGLSVPAERAGGLAAPKFPALDGLSRTLGPVAGVQTLIEDLPITPATLIGSTKLLGVIDLMEMIDKIKPSQEKDLPSDLQNLFDNLEHFQGFLTNPLLTTVRAGSDFETRFLWKPKIKETGLPAPLEKTPAGDMQLIMKGRIKKSRNAAGAFEVDGALKNFRLAFGDLLTLDFEILAFKFRPGEKMRPEIKVRSFEFGKALAFVKPILKLLSTVGLGDAFKVQPQADGVIVRYGVGLPAFGLGVLNLADIAFSSSMSLPFVEGKPAAVRVSLSERSRPFLVSVSIFGGTGFFAVEVRTDKTVRVEAAIEFGGIASINLLGIVKGGVYLFAGVYVSLESGGVAAVPAISGFVRLGGYLDVLSIISVSIEFYLALEYKSEKLAAEGRLTIGIKVLFFSESFSFTIRREIASFGETPTEVVTMAFLIHPTTLRFKQPEITSFKSTVSELQWEKYCRAFA